MSTTNNTVSEASPDTIFGLLNSKEKSRVLEKGIKHIQNGYAAEDAMSSLQQCKKYCSISKQTIVSFLYAPISTLNLHKSIAKALSVYPALKRNCDFYKHKLTLKTLAYIPKIRTKRARKISQALMERKLPPLEMEVPNTAIYAFFDAESRSIVTPREAYLLQAVRWGFVDVRDAAERAEIAPGQIEAVINKIKRALEGNMAELIKT